MPAFPPPEESWNDVFTRIYPKVLARVRRGMGERLKLKETSGDIAQRVMLDFLQRLQHMSFETEAQVIAVLGRVTENVIRGQADYYAAQCRSLAVERGFDGNALNDFLIVDTDGRSPSSSAAANEERARFEVGRALLSPRDQQILYLTEYLRMSFVEIGRELGVGADAIRKQRERALARLTTKMLQLENHDFDGAVTVDED